MGGSMIEFVNLYGAPGLIRTQWKRMAAQIIRRLIVNHYHFMDRAADFQARVLSDAIDREVLEKLYGETQNKETGDAEHESSSVDGANHERS